MKRRMVRAVTGLLCAILLLSNMTDIRVHAMEETGQGIQMEEYGLEDDTWEEKDEKQREQRQQSRRTVMKSLRSMPGRKI